MIILIPAYKPDGQLLKLIASVAAADPKPTVVVVDDGSGPDFRQVFDDASRLGSTVIGFPANRGKGHALKTGFAFIAAAFPGRDVVCADSDGQHRVQDILRVAGRLPAASDAMVLGSRNFSGDVPAPSRVGNTATRWLFRLATGENIPDTQTGLRGYPAAMLPWLTGVPGERYEYGLNLLLEARRAGYLIRTVGIATVYLDHNTGSRFRPLADSARIYAPLLKFLASSLAAFVVDTGVFLVLLGATGSVLFAVVAARGLSSAVNFSGAAPSRQAHGGSGTARRELLRPAAVPLQPETVHHRSRRNPGHLRHCRRNKRDSYSSHGPATVPAQPCRES
ncbi:hypothetical protein J2X01_000249 [Arthrobacter ginsengisoli]|uniref:Glycosyltransferase 2-like domain-containing protein n=1 Tax=Arthrobacter ginsengisoli TaxID=1356565 RepID=A0ABU1U7A0_9MICC|nr:glycosyltransferase family 2 protein [Arthrobacter ginsengisoli]MDR7080980.1 hypothetical protein [Arthrobacter ginsengisoli]